MHPLSFPSTTGTFPEEMKSLSNLEQLWMEGNEFHGTLPSGDFWDHFPKMEKMRVGRFGEDFGGTLPTQIGLLNSSTLSLLFVAEIDGLTGTVPTELAQLTSLAELYLHNTSLTSTIPVELGERLTNLDFVTISETKLTGSIPDDLCSKVKDMEYFCLLSQAWSYDICSFTAPVDFNCSQRSMCGCASCNPCSGNSTGDRGTTFNDLLPSP